MVYSFEVKGANKGTKNFANLYVGVPVSDKIGRKGGTRSSIGKTWKNGNMENRITEVLKKLKEKQQIYE